MSQEQNNREAAQWRCGKCDESLVITRVHISYLANGLPIDLPRCPRCGQVFITEELATGKMLEVEKALEDK